MISKLSGAYYAVTSMVHISNINTLKSIYYAFFPSIIKYGIIFMATLPTVERYSFYKSKSPELWLLHNPEFHVEVCLNY
jgi:hypothetical protein